MRNSTNPEDSKGPKHLRSRVAYLQGLAAGLDLDAATREGRIISEMLDVFSDLAESLDGLAAGQEDLESYVDVLDADLAELEDELLRGDGDGLTLGEVLDGPRHAPAYHAAVPIAESYCCPACGEDVPGPRDEADHDQDPTAQGTIVLRLVCPQCGHSFGATEPGTVTYTETEDELTGKP